MNDEFFVGYLPPPPASSKRMKLAAAALLLSTAFVACALARAHRVLPASVFEYGVTKEIEGVVREAPHPTLVVGDTPANLQYYLLVAEGKHGADSMVFGLDGQRAVIRGSLIHRDGAKMIEVHEIIPGGRAERLRIQGEDLGEIAATGEIVDSKCYLGVMNPGETKTHRDCAVRCISGGAPPMLVSRDKRRFLLVGSDGRQLNRELLDFVAEPVEIRGRAMRVGDVLTLWMEPTEIRRLAN